jgi:hypothetical protein
MSRNDERDVKLYSWQSDEGGATVDQVESRVAEHGMRSRCCNANHPDLAQQPCCQPTSPIIFDNPSL